MRRFRPPTHPLGPWTGEPDRLMDLIDAVWLPAHFFVAPSLTLTWEFVPREEVPWEFYQGRLVEARHCRQARTMSGWNIYQIEQGRRSEEPLLTIKVSWQEQKVHVLRGIQVYLWEPSEMEGAVIEGQEAKRWLRELVGSISLERFSDLEELRDELNCFLWQAVVGTSRLPLTSVETPLPFFSFGLLHYVFRGNLEGGRGHPEASRPLRTWRDLLGEGLSQAMGERERAKLLEFFLRGYPAEEREGAARLCLESLGFGARIPRLLRKMFNEVSLSPYTGFVGHFLDFVAEVVFLGGMSPEEALDLLALLLRQNYHHLLAYDLVTFHQRGANYPDALLLEGVLPRFAKLLGSLVGPREQMERMDSWLMALVQGCLLLHRYRDHAVPDEPTSPGENVRVLPGPYRRVPEEQMEQPRRRRRQLFSGWDWQKRLGPEVLNYLRSALRLLEGEEAFRRLGTAVFIDRPFGEGKALLEPDQTLLLAHEAFSLILANAQVARWQKLLEELGFTLVEEEKRLLRPRAAEEVGGVGLPVERLAGSRRPVPSLADAGRVAPDFLVVRTLPGSLRAFFDCFEGKWQVDLKGGEVVLVARVKEGEGSGIGVFDAEMRMRWQGDVDSSEGFATRAGLEFPVAGLK